MPPTPQAAKAAFHAGGAVTLVNSSRVSAAQALAVSKQPGWVSQGTPGVGDPCWSVTSSVSYGTWPYARTSYLYTYWCAVLGSYITYRASNTYHSTSGICSGSGDSNWRYSGGVGTTYVDVYSQTYFSCPTPWWFTLNDRVWEIHHYNTWGQAWFVSYGDS
jgi:hypothetical protein